MLVNKILEATLTAGQTTVTFTDTDIPNSIISTNCSDPDVFPVSSSLSGNTVTLTYEKQSSDIYVALYLVKQGLDVVDNVTTDDATKALSAKQGKLLKDAIDAIVIPASYPASDITYDNTTSGMTATDVQDAIDEVFTSVSDGKELIADAITDKGVTTSATDSFSTMADNIAAIPSGGSSSKAYYIRTASTSGSQAALAIFACDGDSRLYYNTWLQYNQATSGVTIGDIVVRYNTGTYKWEISSNKQVFSVSSNDYLSTLPSWMYSSTYEDMLVTV